MIVFMYKYSNNFYFVNYDDTSYILYAKHMLNGTFNTFSSPYAYGYVLPATVALSFAAFGQNNFAAGLPAMIEYMTLIILSYIILLKLFPNRYAFAGALMLAVSAFIAAYTYRVLPDMPAGVLIALACYFLLSGKPSRAVIAGALIGATIFIKMGVLLVAPIFIIVLLIYKPRLRGIAFALGLSIAIIIYFATIGWHFSIIQAYSINQVRINTTNLVINSYTALFTYTFNFLNNYQIFTLGLLLFLTLPGFMLAVKRKDAIIQQFGLIFIAFYIYLFFGTESITKWAFIVVVSRYFIWVAIPMVISSIYFIQWLVEKAREKQQNITLAFIVLCSIAVNIPMLWVLH